MAHVSQSTSQDHMATAFHFFKVNNLLLELLVESLQLTLDESSGDISLVDTSIEAPAAVPLSSSPGTISSPLPQADELAAWLLILLLFDSMVDGLN